MKNFLVKYVAEPLGIAILLAVCFVPIGCAEYQKLTGADTTAINATAEKQIMTDVYNASASAATQSVGVLTGPNAQNGADVVQSLWIGAAESAGINAVGQLILDYGGPLVAPLEAKITAALSKVPAPLLTAAKQTAAAAVQNVVYSNPATAPVASPTPDPSVP